MRPRRGGHLRPVVQHGSTNLHQRLPHLWHLRPRAHACSAAAMAENGSDAHELSGDEARNSPMEGTRRARKGNGRTSPHRRSRGQSARDGGESKRAWAAEPRMPPGGARGCCDARQGRGAVGPTGTGAASSPRSAACGPIPAGSGAIFLIAFRLTPCAQQVGPVERRAGAQRRQSPKTTRLATTTAQTGTQPGPAVLMDAVGAVGPRMDARTRVARPTKMALTPGSFSPTMKALRVRSGPPAGRSQPCIARWHRSRRVGVDFRWRGHRH